MMKTEPQAASSAQYGAGPGDAGPGAVECDSCIGRKHKATNSCLVCLASYCEDHLKPHYQSQAFKKHKLVKACADLQEKICSQHGKLIEVYCRTDRSFICYLCTMKEHKGHETVLAEDERNIKQNELNDKQMKFQQRIQVKQKKVQELKQTRESIQTLYQAAVDDNEEIFTELIRSMEKRCSESLPSLCVSPGCDDSPIFTVNQHFSFDQVKKSVSDLKKRVKKICQEEFKKIPPHVTTVLLSKPEDRDDFLKDFIHLTLDPNTAHHELLLSEENRIETRGSKAQRYSDHPERFDSRPQVLCKESVCGRGYWEVEWSRMGVAISVSYKEISRKGDVDESVFEHNSQSWSLVCFPSSVSFWHNNIKTKLQGSASYIIGVYVDHSAGILSFYNVSDTMRLLHRVHTTFTQPLYPGFSVYKYYSDVRLCDEMLVKAQKINSNGVCTIHFC
ncbi:E3 ubiquitin/ISG15 ligase TRIM25-like [Silurus meridionalis]|uniref:E3 ubiquitin/ISG15 ligase TRIM25-like n=1 Tax=Silurus meridionalis TaxID=175797 RepID=UPI001EEA1687|nr:E3 ubiquitin/ISG15 ligase TRIM25-like [Silurus meridionalis]